MKLTVTGHRPDKLWGYGKDPRYDKLRDRFVSYLTRAGVTDAYTGMALGVDTVFAEAVLKLRDTGFPIKLHCCIPCQGHCSKWTQSAQRHYRSILSRADTVTLVTDAPYNNRCMQARNEYMVDRCDRVLAIWDGSRGGTGNCVSYAKKRGVKVQVVNPSVIQ